MTVSLEAAEQAMHWQLELQAPDVSEQTRADWQRWREQDPAHELAWQHSQRFFQRLQGVRAPAHQALVSAALLPALSRRQVVKHLAVLLAAGTTTWSIKHTELLQHWASDYSTSVGERWRIDLADNTQVQLNTDTAIDVQYTPQLRQIHVLRGEILVAPNPTDARPLWVKTAEGLTRAVSGRFSVRQRSGFTQLGAVDQGALSVQLPSGSLVLQAGELISFDAHTLLARRPQRDGELAWSGGMIVAQGMRLEDFLDELGRYRRGHLACEPTVRDLRVSGTYPLADTDRILAALAQTLRLDVQHFTRFWVTLKPRQGMV
ncbi:FecR domain-containing protein [Pseudomonas sp. P115]|uniref:FecR domain-containing protein n=1 Tax=Pseudomonas pisciculturae TaxID=2730413 RepID=UPI00135C7A37|nr:FecR domain-containing protein [Pseudomonas pisciculturae]MBF6029463.1 FecR domain-containing protein [Pseudomonas pisciculturae]